MPSLRRRPLPLVATSIAIALATLAGCGGGKAAREDESGITAYSCRLGGEHVVVRLETDEVRLLMPTGDRVILYRIPSGPGVRYSNGTYELTAKGAELTLVENGAARKLEGCELIPQAH